MSEQVFRAAQELDVDAPIELWTVDNSAKNGAVYRFHSQNKSGTDSSITFDGQVYEAAPVEVKGLKQSSNGPPRPTLSMAKALAVNLGLLVDPDLLLGAVATRVKTFAQHLPTGSDPDPTATFPTVVVYFEQLESVTDSGVTYLLSDPSALPSALFPRQNINANLCSACYRGGTCQYAGVPLTDKDGNLFTGTTDEGTWDFQTAYAQDDYISIVNQDGVPFVWVALIAVPAGVRPGSLGSDLYWSLDSCNKLLDDTGCKLRFTAAEGYPFDAFPGASLVPTS